MFFFRPCSKIVVGSQLGVNLHPRGHLAKSENTFGCENLGEEEGTTGIQSAETGMLLNILEGTG